MIFKYDFSISGDNLYPEKIINKIQGNFIIDSYFRPTDKRLFNLPGTYGYGGMSFRHPKKFATEDNIREYEAAFVDFIEKNYNLLVEAGVDDFKIFMEIYYDGEQCNFEIFDKLTLNKLTQYSISIPVSVYFLSEQEVSEWENKIKQKWIIE